VKNLFFKGEEFFCFWLLYYGTHGTHGTVPVTIILNISPGIACNQTRPHRIGCETSGKNRS
jgi:hypothetical protein